MRCRTERRYVGWATHLQPSGSATKGYVAQRTEATRLLFYGVASIFITQGQSAMFDSPVTPVTNTRKIVMSITLNLIPIVSLIAGILILVVPRLLSTIVAIYLIMVGLVGLFGSGQIFR